jgi:aspartate aminotransferase-like enzyme
MVTVILLLLVLAGCGQDPCPEGSMLTGDEGLVVTAAEHGDGWGQAECDACHARVTLHRTGCTPDVDLEAIQDMVADEGLDSCALCHGDNGVEAP